MRTLRQNPQAAQLRELYLELIADLSLYLVENGGFFAHLTGLEILSLQSCRFTSASLHTLPFLGLSRLRRIVFNGNLLTSLGPEAFKGLGALEELDLRFNEIASIAPNAFAGLPSLEKLDMSCNYITTLPAGGLFAGLENLRELDLRGYHRGMWHGGNGAFAGAIERFQLLFNRLASIAPGAFAGLRSLRTLLLSEQRLVSLANGTFAGVGEDLEILELDRNRIAALDAGTFSGLTALRQLHLDGNGLGSIANGTFSSLPDLEELTLRPGGNDTLGGGATDQPPGCAGWGLVHGVGVLRCRDRDCTP